MKRTTIEYLRLNWGAVYSFWETADRDFVAQHHESRDTIKADGPGQLLRKVRADYFRRIDRATEGSASPRS